MSETIIPISDDSTTSLAKHPLVKTLRTRAARLKYVSYLYLVLILAALIIGGYLFYQLPIWLSEQDQLINRTQKLFIDKGSLQAQLNFTQSRWQNQRNNALDQARQATS